MNEFYTNEKDNYCYTDTLPSVILDLETNKILVNNDAFYGPWSKSDFGEDGTALFDILAVKMLLGDADTAKNFLPEGFTVGVYLTTDASGDNDPSSLQEWWWLGSLVGWTLKISGSNAGGSSSTVGNGIKFWFTRDNYIILTNSSHTCTSAALKEATLTLIRVFNNTERILFIDGDGSNWKLSSPDLQMVGMVLKSQLVNSDTDNYVEFWYDFENSTGDDYEGIISKSFSATADMLYDTTNYLFTQTLQLNDAGYTYQISVSPGYFSIPKNGECPVVEIDVDKFENLDNSSSKLEETEVTSYVKTYFTTGSTTYQIINTALAGGMSRIDGSSLVYEIDENSNIKEDTQDTLSNICLSNDVLVYGDTIKCIIDDGKVTASYYLPVLRESSLINSISNNYVFSLKNPSDIILSYTYKNLNLDVVHTLTSNSIFYNDSTDLNQVATITNINVSSGNYELVLVDSEGNYHLTTDTKTDKHLFTTYTITSYYFNKLSSDCSITVDAKYIVDETTTRTTTKTYGIMFVSTLETYTLSINPTINPCTDNVPQYSTLNFVITQYLDGASVLTLSDLDSKGLHIELNGSTISLVNLLYTLDAALDYTKSFTLTFYLIDSNGIVRSTASSSCFPTPKDVVKAPELIVKNGSVIVSNKSTNEALAFASASALAYFNGQTERSITFNDDVKGITKTIGTIYTVNLEKLLDTDVDEIAYLMLLTDFDSGTTTLVSTVNSNDEIGILKYDETSTLVPLSLKVKYSLYGDDDLNSDSLLAVGYLTISIAAVTDGISFKVLANPNTLYKTTNGKLTDDADDYINFLLQSISDGTVVSNSLNDASNTYLEVVIKDESYQVSKYSYTNITNSNTTIWSVPVYSYLTDSSGTLHINSSVTVNAYYNGKLVDSLTLHWCIVAEPLYSILLSNDSIMISTSATETDVATISSTVVTILKGVEEYEVLEGLKLTSTITSESPLYKYLRTEVTSSDGLSCQLHLKSTTTTLAEASGYVTIRVYDGETLLGVKRQIVNIIKIPTGNSYRLIVYPNTLYQDGSGSISPEKVTCLFNAYRNGTVTSGFDGTTCLYYLYVGDSTINQVEVTADTESVDISINPTKMNKYKGLIVNAGTVVSVLNGYKYNIDYDEDSLITFAGTNWNIYSNQVIAATYNGKSCIAKLVKVVPTTGDTYYVMMILPDSTLTRSEFYIDIANNAIMYGDTNITSPMKTVCSNSGIGNSVKVSNHSIASLSTPYFTVTISSALAFTSSYSIPSTDLEEVRTNEAGTILDSETVGLAALGQTGAGSGYNISLDNDNCYIANTTNNATLASVSGCTLQVQNESGILSFKTDYFVKPELVFFDKDGVDQSSVFDELVLDSKDGNMITNLVKSSDSINLPVGSGHILYKIYSDSSFTDANFIGQKIQSFSIVNLENGTSYKLIVTPQSVYRSSDYIFEDTDFSIQLWKYSNNSAPERKWFNSDSDWHVFYVDSNNDQHEIEYTDNYVGIYNNLVKLGSDTNLISIPHTLYSLKFIACVYDGATQCIVDVESVDFVQQGSTGASGGVIRLRGRWDDSTAYCYMSDTNTDFTDYNDNSDNKYIDVVEYDVSETDIRFYQCLKGDSSDKNINKCPYNENGLESEYWQLSDNYKLIITDAMIADKVQTSQLLITHNDETTGSPQVVGGMIGSDSTWYSETQKDIEVKTILWAGDPTEDVIDAPFQVLEDGTIKCRKGYFGGTSVSECTVITANNVLDYVKWKQIPTTNVYRWCVDLEKTGTNIVFYESPDEVNSNYSGRELYKGYGSIRDVLEPIHSEDLSIIFYMHAYADKLKTDDGSEEPYIDTMRTNKISSAASEYNLGKAYLNKLISICNATNDNDLYIYVYGIINQITTSTGTTTYLDYENCRVDPMYEYCGILSLIANPNTNRPNIGIKTLYIGTSMGNDAIDNVEGLLD